MRRFYLDTNALSRLATLSTASIESERIMDRLVVDGQFEILGSLELLGELVPVSVTHEAEYIRLVDLFWVLCERRVLRPWNELVRGEIQKGAPLSLKEAYLDIPVRNAVEELTRGNEPYDEWINGVQNRKEEYAEEMGSAAAAFEEEAVQRWGESEVKKSTNDMRISREMISDWGKSAYIRRDPGRHRLSADESTWPDLSVLPCCRAYVSMYLAWVIKRHAANRIHRGADYYDSMHYVLASMTNTFVTDDKALRHAISMIQWRPNRVISLEGFAAVVTDS